MPAAARTLLTLNEAADHIRVSRDTLRAWALAGQFPPAFRIGGRRRLWRVDATQFELWLEDQIPPYQPESRPPARVMTSSVPEILGARR